MKDDRGCGSKILHALNCFGKADGAGGMFRTFAQRGDNLSKMFPAILSVAITVLALIYLYPIDYDDIQFDGQEYFAVSALGARNAIFVSSIVMSTSVIASLAVGMLAKKEIYASAQELYNSNYLHTTLSVFIVSGWFLWLNLSDPDGAGATEQDKALPGIWLLIATITAYVLKLFLDMKFGKKVEDYDAVFGAAKLLDPTLEDKRFQTSRQMGSMISIMLTIYFLVAFAAEIDFSNMDWESTGSSMMLLVFLFAYTLVISVEAKAVSEGEEQLSEVQKGWINSGVTISQVLLYVIFFFVGGFIATHTQKEGIFVALMVLYLEGLQIGIGQLGSEVKSGAVTFVYRFIQFFLGILAIVAITPTTSASSAKIATKDTASAVGHLEALSTILWGVGLASGVIKVFQASFMDDLRSPSPAQTFRKFSSTGLLIASSALWVGGAGFTAPDTLNTTFSTSLFVLALLNRLLDSFVDSSMDDGGFSGGLMELAKDYAFGGWIPWIVKSESEEATGLESPTIDNVRSWMVLASLGTSLGLLLQWSDVKTNLNGYAGVACGLIVLHMVVVVVALLDGVVPESSRLKPATKFLSLSRSSAIRFVVSTTVICSLIIVASDSGNLVSGGHLKTGDHVENWIIGSLVAYLFADAVGAEFL